MISVLIIMLVFTLILNAIPSAHAPSDTTTVTLEATADSHVNSFNPDLNYGSETNIRTDITTGATKDYNYTYLMFDLSSIPSGAVIKSANLSLYLTGMSGNVPMGIGRIYVHYCSANSWTELGITWNNKPSFDSEATSYRSFGPIVTVSKYYDWNVTSDVSRALSNGKLSEVVKWSSYTDSDAWARATFQSKEAVGGNPKLIIEYSTLADLSDFPEPFVVGEALNFTMVIAETGPHGAFGAGALTIDVYSAVVLGEALGMHATSGSPECVLDTWIATYNSGTGRVDVQNTEDNLISVAGYGVNLVTYEYFTDFVAAFSDSRTPAAPVYMHRDWDPTPANVQTWIVFPGQPLTYSDWDITAGSSDYCLIELVYDVPNGRYVLCVNSFTAQGTDAGCQVLSALLRGKTLSFSLGGEAALLEWVDGNADSQVQLAEVSLIETYP
jgi:hypothetical protein